MTSVTDAHPVRRALPPPRRVGVVRSSRAHDLELGRRLTPDGDVELVDLDPGDSADVATVDVVAAADPDAAAAVGPAVCRSDTPLLAGFEPLPDDPFTDATVTALPVLSAYCDVAGAVEEHVALTTLAVIGEGLILETGAGEDLISEQLGAAGVRLHGPVRLPGHPGGQPVVHPALDAVILSDGPGIVRAVLPRHLPLAVRAAHGAPLTLTVEGDAVAPPAGVGVRLGPHQRRLQLVTPAERSAHILAHNLPGPTRFTQRLTAL